MTKASSPSPPPPPPLRRSTARWRAGVPSWTWRRLLWKLLGVAGLTISSLLLGLLFNSFWHLSWDYTCFKRLSDSSISSFYFAFFQLLVLSFYSKHKGHWITWTMKPLSTILILIQYTRLTDRAEVEARDIACFPDWSYQRNIVIDITNKGLTRRSSFLKIALYLGIAQIAWPPPLCQTGTI